MLVLSGALPMTFTLNQYLLFRRKQLELSLLKVLHPSSQIFSALNILRLYDLFDLKSITFVYQPKNKLSPNHLASSC